MTTRILLALAAAACLLSADTVVLKNGSRVEGSFLGGDSRSIRFATGSQINTYYLNDIESIRFSGAQTENPGASISPYPVNPPHAPAAQAPMPPYPQAPYPQASAAPPPVPPAANSPAMEVPAGTQIVVRMIDPVNSEGANLGQTYRASVDQPVVVNGQTVIPRGADAIACLVDTQTSGHIEGRTVLTLDLRSIAVNGRNYDVATTGVPQASGSRGARSAKVIGGAAALGAIIGAAAGGGKGAAIGAGSGAAVGTAAEVATSGQKVKVPAETRLTFTLQNPIDL